MINTPKLRGIMAEKNVSGKEMAEIIGIAPKTFYEKMSKGVFDSDEIQTMIDYLDIWEPTGIFFAKSVTHELTKEKNNAENKLADKSPG